MLMKYPFLIIILFFSLACYSQQWPFGQEINAEYSYGVPDGQEFAEQYGTYGVPQVQLNCTDSIPFAINACGLQGKWNKPAKAAPLCTTFYRKHFLGLYAYVGCKAMDKKKNSVN
ncbi:hypothetical protein FGF1_28970 [Flavobacteriaceae bacterium GF1]